MTAQVGLSIDFERFRHSIITEDGFLFVVAMTSVACFLLFVCLYFGVCEPKCSLCNIRCVQFLQGAEVVVFTYYF